MAGKQKPWKPTAKQQRFIEEYAVDFNATQAAIRAGYSKKTACKIGSENLHKPDIQAAIAKQVEKVANRAEISAERVLRELGRIGFLDPRELFDERGNLIPVKELPSHVAAAIQSIEVVQRKDADGEWEDVVKIKLWDKKGSLELLGRHLRLYTDQLDLTSKNEVRVIERRIVDPGDSV